MATSIEKPARHLDPHTSFLMVAVAILFDGVQFALVFLNVIPILGTIVCIFISAIVWIYAYLTFKTWYASHNIDSHLFEKAGARIGIVKLLRAGWIAARISEHIPLLANVIPGITIGVIAMNIVVYLNDHFERRQWEQKLTRLEAFLWRRSMANANEYRNVHIATQKILQDEAFTLEQRRRLAQKIRMEQLGKEIALRHSSV